MSYTQMQKKPPSSRGIFPVNQPYLNSKPEDVIPLKLDTFFALDTQKSGCLSEFLRPTVSKIKGIIQAPLIFNSFETFGILPLFDCSEPIKLGLLHGGPFQFDPESEFRIEVTSFRLTKDWELLATISFEPDKEKLQEFLYKVMEDVPQDFILRAVTNFSLGKFLNCNAAHKDKLTPAMLFDRVCEVLGHKKVKQNAFNENRKQRPQDLRKGRYPTITMRAKRITINMCSPYDQSCETRFLATIYSSLAFLTDKELSQTKNLQDSATASVQEKLKAELTILYSNEEYAKERALMTHSGHVHAIDEARSTRGYHPDPVSDDIKVEIEATSQRRIEKGIQEINSRLNANNDSDLVNVQMTQDQVAMFQDFMNNTAQPNPQSFQNISQQGAMHSTQFFSQNAGTFGASGLAQGDHTIGAAPAQGARVPVWQASGPGHGGPPVPGSQAPPVVRAAVSEPVPVVTTGHAPVTTSTAPPTTAPGAAARPTTTTVTTTSSSARPTSTVPQWKTNLIVRHYQQLVERAKFTCDVADQVQAEAIAAQGKPDQQFRQDIAQDFMEKAKIADKEVSEYYNTHAEEIDSMDMGPARPLIPESEVSTLHTLDPGLNAQQQRTHPPRDVSFSFHTPGSAPPTVPGQGLQQNSFSFVPITAPQTEAGSLEFPTPGPRPDLNVPYHPASAPVPSLSPKPQRLQRRRIINNGAAQSASPVLQQQADRTTDQNGNQTTAFHSVLQSPPSHIVSPVPVQAPVLLPHPGLRVQQPGIVIPNQISSLYPENPLQQLVLQQQMQLQQQEAALHSLISNSSPGHMQLSPQMMGIPPASSMPMSMQSGLPQVTPVVTSSAPEAQIEQLKMLEISNYLLKEFPDRVLPLRVYVFHPDKYWGNALLEAIDRGHDNPFCVTMEDTSERTRLPVGMIKFRADNNLQGLKDHIQSMYDGNLPWPDSSVSQIPPHQQASSSQMQAGATMSMAGAIAKTTPTNSNLLPPGGRPGSSASMFNTSGRPTSVMSDPARSRVPTPSTLTPEQQTSVIKKLTRKVNELTLKSPKLILKSPDDDSLEVPGPLNNVPEASGNVSTSG